MSYTGADLLVESLIEAGVRYLFSLSGNQIMPVFDATVGRDIGLMHTRHEAAAVHMADAWGRMTEQPGIALLTAGPGHCNAVSALYVARMAESPLVMLSGHAPLSQLNRGAFQEIDQVATVKPVTKAAWMVESADRLAGDFASAFCIAQSGRPGPVHLSLPADILIGAASHSETPDGRAEETPPSAASDTIASMLEHLASAQRPLILAGPAMARAKRWADVRELSAATGIPALPIDSPRGVNDPWLHGATNSLSRADAVLLVGKKLDFALRFGRLPFFAEDCRFMQIEAEKSALSDADRVVLAVHADPQATLRQLTREALARKWPKTSWPSEVASANNSTPPEWDSIRRSAREPIHPLRICEALQPFLGDGAIFISDGGEFGQWMQAGIKAETRLINGPSGSIGSSLPMGLGAKAAHPNRTVFVTMGDGTFGFHALEIDTAVRCSLPIVVIVGNDARWNAEHQIQIRDYGQERTVGCELLPTRYDRVAEALGGHGELVQHPEELKAALERAVASGLPACVNVMIESVAAPSFRS